MVAGYLSFKTLGSKTLGHAECRARELVLIASSMGFAGVDTCDLISGFKRLLGIIPFGVGFLSQVSGSFGRGFGGWRSAV